VEAGIILAYWNTSDQAKGCWTNSVKQRFNSKAACVVMNLVDGGAKNLVSGSGLEFTAVNLDYYAMAPGSTIQLQA
jgi:hypothetical protein